MFTTWFRAIFCALLVVTLGACATPQRGTGAQDAATSRPEGSGGPKRITIAINVEPPALHYNLIPNPVRANPGSIQEILNPGLTAWDNEGTLRPILAEAVPTVDNGLWKVLPDGRMEMTWTVKQGATWHDGTPVSAADLAFTLSLMQDRELAVFRDKYSDLIESYDTPDNRTITVTWKTPYIEADTLFTYTRGLVVPKHLLETAYQDTQDNKRAFLEQPYWSTDYVGTGPFRLKDWLRGSHLTLAAYPAYLLGKPKLDEIEVDFINDGNTLISNILAGSVDLTLRQALSVDQALPLRDSWKDGKVYTAADGWAVIYPQMINPTPAVLANVQFRKALITAIDRQQLAEELMAGLLPVADSPLFPGTPEYRATESQIVKYTFDPQRAGQMIEGLGYTKGSDGVFRDAAGQKLSVEVRATAQRDLHIKTLFPVVNYWQQLGLDVQPLVIPAQNATNLEEQATFPGLQVLRQPAGRSKLISFHSSEARLPERNFTGSNNGRYINADLDALVDRYTVTIPPAERLRVTGQIVHHLTDQLPVLPLFFDATPSLVHNRLKGITPLNGDEDARQAWNAQDWYVE
jgi:peptide/nickel transport system substrate-binding protein